VSLTTKPNVIDWNSTELQGYEGAKGREKLSRLQTPLQLALTVSPIALLQQKILRIEDANKDVITRVSITCMPAKLLY
jgi:hypothetical protein